MPLNDYTERYLSSSAYLILEDGKVFPGKSIGAYGHTSGEVVFSTSMTGYQEALTDPSFRGQLLTMTYPLQGNYGTHDSFSQSENIQVRGFIVKELTNLPSHWKSSNSLDSYLEKANITGIAEIDEIETIYSSAIALTLGVGGTGDFTAGEIVTGGTTGVEAEVKSWDNSTRILQVINRKGTFSANESLTGDSSGAVWVVSTFDTLQNTNSEYDANREIEDAADNLIDWTEGNPFGEFGNFTGSI